MGYITYDIYTQYGGTLDEPIFLKYSYDVEVKLNYLTFNRIKKLTDIPEAIGKLIVKLIDLYNENATGINQLSTITSYSNGIESFGYSTSESNLKGSTQFDSRIYAIVKEYLSDYPELLYRGNKYDNRNHNYMQ